MDALCNGNKFWASAFLDAVQDTSCLFGVTMATNEIYTILGQHFHKLLVEPEWMAEWAQQSGAVLLRASSKRFNSLDLGLQYSCSHSHAEVRLGCSKWC